MALLFPKGENLLPKSKFIPLNLYHILKGLRDLKEEKRSPKSHTSNGYM